MSEPMVQYEFPFTRTGQLQAYNNQQLGHMYNTYRDYIDINLLPHTANRWKSWQHLYVDSGAAKIYADEHKADMFGPVVEQDNMAVVSRWKSNKLHSKSIEDIL